MARTGPLAEDRPSTGTLATNVSTPLESGKNSTWSSLPRFASSTCLSSKCGTEKVMLDHMQAQTARQEALTQRAGTNLSMYQSINVYDTFTLRLAHEAMLHRLCTRRSHRCVGSMALAGVCLASVNAAKTLNQHTNPSCCPSSQDSSESCVTAQASERFCMRLDSCAAY